MTGQPPQANAPNDKKQTAPTVEERSIAPSDTASLAPLLQDSHHRPSDEAGGPSDAPLPRRKSLLQRFKDERAERKAIHRNLYDNGPYELVFDPNLGKEVLRKNPHWPYEDSWKRENVGLTVKKGMEGQPDFVKQQTGKWGQTGDSSAQEYFNGYTAGEM
ncbi:hypothetical protein B0A55_06187 [Friedmanniomyces simplex]|uniref:Uncharacterized protein n=1 Tax=Friedmanniomyces simplex TaxID=329884 RepID=A0A4U0X8F2_9PEZI|nr:hypothetical protein B0A55_06187 [Friedmanniomyces simplex]